MKISPSWIRDFVSPAASDREIADALTVSGIAIEGFFGTGPDATWEAEITTNRVDAMNHYGVAREVSAIYDVDLAPLAPQITATAAPNVSIRIEAVDGCARYTARVVRGVNVAATPEKIAHRLALVEQRSISNVADATNYVLNELGQPTHAFDLDKIEGATIVVRHARAGETLVTLDGVERQLAAEDLVIADAVKPLGLAGIMGGEASMITERTKNVFIESAWFDPAAIRRTARRLGMHTDASHRYERGADRGITQLACARVVELILQSAGGEASTEVDVRGQEIPQPVVTLAASEVERILGVAIPANEIARILRRLGFVVESLAGASFRVTVPTWRLDVEREIDLIEEVARIYSFSKIPNTLPSFSGGVVELSYARHQATLRTRLLALGYNESLTTTFIPLDDARLFGVARNADGTVAASAAAVEPVRVANPLSEEASFMRTTLVAGLVQQVAYNLNRGNSDVRLFESGHVYAMAGANASATPSATAKTLGDRKAGSEIDECHALAFVATGNARPASPHARAEALSFFHLKGDVEQLLSAFEATISFDREVPAWLHPGRAARVVATLPDGKQATVAVFGQLHPEQAATRKLKQDVWIAELFVESLYQLALRQPTYRPISKYPAVERDFSFVVPDAVEFSAIRTKLSALSISELIKLEPAEVFRGGNLAAGTYSLLLRTAFQSSERTLRDDEVATWSEQIVGSVTALGGALRQ